MSNNSQVDANRISKCKSNCVTCNHMIETSTINFKNRTDPFYIKFDFTCTTRNLIYLLVCTCGLEYIGQTNLMLKQRIVLHRSQCRDPKYRFLKVSKHLHECGNDNFTVYPFYKMHEENETARVAKEQFFIRKFRPQLNSDTWVSQ